MIETWTSICGYEGSYEVSDFGRIRSLDRLVKCGNGLWMRPGTILRNVIDDCGYARVSLCNDSTHLQVSVHRTVALHFIQNPRNLPEVNHRDCNKLNNHIVNLEWATHQGNAKHAGSHGCLSTTAKTHPKKARKLTAEDVDVLRQLAAEGASAKELARWFSISNQTVYLIINGKRRR